MASSFDGRTVRRFAVLLVGGFLALAGSSLARAETAGDAVASRHACEAALALEAQGGKVSSRLPCHSALLYGGQSEDLRNEVASLLAPARSVTLDDLAAASMLADAALRKDSSQPWGYLARCDIARRIGSADVLASCLADLQRVAPQHAATLAALATPPVRVPAWIWITRAALFIALLGSCLHAVSYARRRRREPAGVAKPVVVAFIVVGALLGGIPLGAALAGPEGRGPQGDLSIFKIDEADPESSVPSVEARAKQPLQFGYYIQDLTARAEKATKTGDHVAAARYYKALAKTAPDIAFAPRKLCESLEAAGDLANAVKACRSALTRGGSTVGDFTRFVSLVLAQRDPLPKGEKEELDTVLKHLDEQGATSLGADLPILHCEVALRFHDTPALQQCTSTLGQLAPNDPRTVSFQWALALDQHDREAALRFIDRAKGLGVADAGLATMMRATEDMRSRRRTLWALLAVGAVVLALAAVGVTRRFSERRRLTT